MVRWIGQIFERLDGWLEGLDGYLSARTDDWTDWTDI